MIYENINDAGALQLYMDTHANIRTRERERERERKREREREREREGEVVRERYIGWD